MVFDHRTKSLVPEPVYRCDAPKCREQATEDVVKGPPAQRSRGTEGTSARHRSARGVHRVRGMAGT